MIKANLTFPYLKTSVLTIVLLTLPLTYFAISYAYLVWWHDKVFLWHTLIHENGRLTLLGSLFYFDHFVGVVLMVTMFALSTAGGFALAGRVPSGIDVSRTVHVAIILLGGAMLLVLVAFIASIEIVGWQRTIDYAFQRIERDGIMSKGGNWNQLQLSNIPIALGVIGMSSSLVAFPGDSGPKGNASMIAGAKTCIGMAAALCIGISAFNWCGWQCFLNPRWLAHGIREVATYPLTGIPIALASVLLVERYLSGVKK